MLSKRLGILFALSPILSIYMIGVPVLSLSQILILFASFLCILRYRERGVMVFFKAFIVYAVAISVLRFIEPWVLIGESIHDILSLLLFFFTVFCQISYADYDSFKSTIIKLGRISLYFFLFQYILSVMGVRISGIIPFLPLSNEIPTSDFIASQLERDRLSGLFQEPAHYAQFMTVVLVFILFSDEYVKRKYLLAGLISLSIIMCSSAFGLVMLVAVWGIWAFVFHLRDSKHKTLYIIGLLLTSLVIIFLASRNENILSVTGRISELGGESSSEHGRSTYIRVVRGFIPFIESDFWHMILGNGLGTLNSFVISHPQSNYLLLTDFDPKWINGLQYLLFNTGVVGLLLYLWEMAYFFKHTSPIGKVFIVCILLLFISSDSFFSIDIFIYAIVIEMFIKEGSYCPVSNDDSASIPETN